MAKISFVMHTIRNKKEIFCSKNKMVSVRMLTSVSSAFKSSQNLHVSLFSYPGPNPQFVTTGGVAFRKILAK